MKREELKAEERKVTGKQVRKLRREGILPANIYGKNFDSLSIQLPIKEFEVVYSKAHETGLVDLHVGKDVHPVLIQNVQKDPISKSPVHVDFYKVNLKEKVKSTIPVVAVGEAKAVSDKIGVLLQTLNEIEVEALPTDLPEKIEVNVENLAEIDDNILVGDIATASAVEILTSPDSTVFRIGELVTKEAEELEAEEAAEAEAAAEEGAAETAEGEEKKEEGEGGEKVEEEVKEEPPAEKKDEKSE